MKHIHINVSDRTKFEIHKFIPWALAIVVLIVVIFIFRNILDVKTWDYIAVAVSLAALYIAVRSFDVAKDSLDIATKTLGITEETLESQKATQKNTTPIFTAKSQALVLSKIATQLIDNFCRLSAMNKFLQRANGKGYPLPRLFGEMYVEQRAIHLEITYKEPDYFLKLSLIQQALERYNKSIKSLQHVLEIVPNNRAIINNEMSLLIQQTTDLFSQICNLFKYDNEKPECVKPQKDKLDFLEIKKHLNQFLDDKISPYVPFTASEGKNAEYYAVKVMDLLKSKDNDIYRSIISDTMLYTAISVDIEMFSEAIQEGLEELDWKVEGQENWFIRLLGIISYLYHKNELKDFILISTNGTKDL